MKKRILVPARHIILFLGLPLVIGSSCNILDPDPDDGIAYCTSNVLKTKEFVITPNQIYLNTCTYDGDYVTFEYSSYQNQICPSNTTTVTFTVQVSSEQTTGIGIAFWTEWGPDQLQQIKKNSPNYTLSYDMKTLTYQETVSFIPGEWVTMNDAAIVTTKVRFTFKSSSQNPNVDIIYLSNMFRSLTVTTSYYPY